AAEQRQSVVMRRGSFTGAEKKLRAPAIKPLSPCGAKRATCESLVRSPVSALAPARGAGLRRGEARLWVSEQTELRSPLFRPSGTFLQEGGCCPTKGEGSNRGTRQCSCRAWLDTIVESCRDS